MDAAKFEEWCSLFFSDRTVLTVPSGITISVNSLSLAPKQSAVGFADVQDSVQGVGTGAQAHSCANQAGTVLPTNRKDASLARAEKTGAKKDSV